MPELTVHDLIDTADQLVPPGSASLPVELLVREMRSMLQHYADLDDQAESVTGPTGSTP